MNERRVEEELRRLEPIARNVAGRFFLPNGDEDDLLQEARIGLLAALDQWDGLRPVEHLAYTLAYRRVVDAVHLATRMKRYPELAPVSFDDGGDDGEGTLHERVAAGSRTEELIEHRAQLRAMVGAMCTLTDAERAGLAAVANGEVYSWPHGPTTKRLDNGAQRARRKLAAAVAVHVGA